VELISTPQYTITTWRLTKRWLHFYCVVLG